ncbi:hypothetical protein CYMTET_14335, partial [Cymbomonas tetramitiformis]
MIRQIGERSSRQLLGFVLGLSAFVLCVQSIRAEDATLHQAFPLVRPDDQHTKLAVSHEGLDALRLITTPVAPIIVIGPYRSGKSFLLNQLLGVSCGEGFGVGHQRDTKTKGLWVWGEGKEVVMGGKRISLIYIDTEGFESKGISDAYDDRIFALSAILSS